MTVAFQLVLSPLPPALKQDYIGTWEFSEKNAAGHMTGRVWCSYGNQVGSPKKGAVGLALIRRRSFGQPDV